MVPLRRSPAAVRATTRAAAGSPVVDLGKEDAEGGPRQRGVDELLRGDLAQPLRADVEGQASRLLERGRGEDRVADCGTARGREIAFFRQGWRTAQGFAGPTR